MLILILILVLLQTPILTVVRTIILQPTSGEVIKVIEGSQGTEDSKGKNSYVFVYDEKNNKTVVYMHCNPKVKVGTQLKKGSLIAIEDNRGTKGTHTHVEVVDGKSYYARNSVGDFNLENKNPTSYWFSQGYEF